MYNMMQTDTNTHTKLAKPHIHVMTTQMSVKKGIKKFGNKGNGALLKEINQLHLKQAQIPLNKEDMSCEQRKRALRF